MKTKPCLTLDDCKNIAAACEAENYHARLEGFRVELGEEKI